MNPNSGQCADHKAVVADVSNLHASIHSFSQLLGAIGRDSAMAAKLCEGIKDEQAAMRVEIQIMKEMCQRIADATLDFQREARIAYRKQMCSIPEVGALEENTGVMLLKASSDAAKIEVLQGAISRRDSDVRELRSELKASAARADRAETRRLEWWKLVLGATVTLITGAGGAVGLLHLLK